jgi:hypothetical protein
MLWLGFDAENTANWATASVAPARLSVCTAVRKPVLLLLLLLLLPYWVP